MRMRKKKNLDKRLDHCLPLTVTDPESMCGNWRSLYPEATALHLEVGCGKGRFVVQMAKQNPDVLFIALERERGAVVMAMEKVEREELHNVFFIIGDAASLGIWFGEHEVDRIYINFCDPWTGNRHAKRRLTHRSFLDLYQKIIKIGGTLQFKTDNVELFQFSEMELAGYGLEMLSVTRDLHRTDIPNVMTEYEERFSSQGICINRIEARFPENPVSTYRMVEETSDEEEETLPETVTAAEES